MSRQAGILVSEPRFGAVAGRSLPAWLYLYFVLAGFVLIAVLATLYFNHRIVSLQATSMQSNRGWATKSRLLASLSQAAAEVNLPGNDVFESGDPAREAANLKTALERFEQAYDAAIAESDRLTTPQEAAILARGLVEVRDAVLQMTVEAEQVFALFATSRDEAGVRMAAMDRKYKAVRTAIDILADFVRDKKEHAFDQQEQQAAKLMNWEYGLFALVGLIVAGVVAYAIVLSRKVTRAARIAQQNLALLQASEESLRIETAASARASRAKSAFLANMSHEIRTPMSAIMGYAEMLMDPETTESERQEALQVIRRSSRHLLELINDVLDISKIEADKMTVEHIPTDIRQIASDVVSIMRPSVINKGVQLHLSFGETIPRTIESDPVRVKQVLMNLVGNALKFTQRGEIRVHVSSSVKDNQRFAEFTVTDTGVGMTAEQMQHVFQPFTQADESTTRRFGGTGLGLTISKRLVELLGGAITAESLCGVGSIFRFTVNGGPATEGEMLHDFTESMIAPTPCQATPTSIAICGRILLAEDGADNQRLLSNHLRKAGAEVVVAENGRIAVELAQAKQFDLILMDMQMPELDGYGATAELRRLGQDLPIIALTAHAMAEDREKCLAAGCTDYLTKPIAKHTLISAVANYLVQNTAKREQKPPAVDAGGGGDKLIGDSIGDASNAPAHEPPATPSLRSSFADDPDMTEVLQEFVASLPGRVGELERLLEAGKFMELRRVVHQLKGAGGGYGFDRITELAATTEQSLKEDAPLETIQAEVQTLAALVRSVEGYHRELEVAYG